MRTKAPTISNIRVTVHPDFSYFWRDRSDTEKFEIAEELEKQIKRHCDNVDWTHVDHDRTYHCEFCGSIWTEVDDTYNGGCCDKDEEQLKKDL